jgi:hypothetical protein
MAADAILPYPLPPGPVRTYIELINMNNSPGRIKPVDLALAIVIRVIFAWLATVQTAVRGNGAAVRAAPAAQSPGSIASTPAAGAFCYTMAIAIVSSGTSGRYHAWPRMAIGIVLVQACAHALHARSIQRGNSTQSLAVPPISELEMVY